MEFEKIGFGDFEVYLSPPSHYRARAEFRILNLDGNLSYAMHGYDKRLLPIEDCPKTISAVFDLMPNLLKEIQNSEALCERLFAVEFLGTLAGEVAVTLIYHKRLDQRWREEAETLKERFKIEIIGRSRGQKEVIGRDFVIEELPVCDRRFKYVHKEGSFTQPNPFVNIKMIEWACDVCEGLDGDLLELYCGGGNFTLPLGDRFERVLATEISKSSIAAAKESAKMNGIRNVSFVRLSSEEFARAYRGEREFKRLKQAAIRLDEYRFSTVLVDPPRAGLDGATIDLVREFENILYISCNPQTLLRDAKILRKSHKIVFGAFFDQFPYTPHLECALLFRR